MNSRPSLRAEAIVSASGGTLMRVNFATGQEETEKVLTVEEFASILMRNTIREKALRIGKLPNGFYDGSLGERTSSIVITVPAQERPFCLQGIPMRIPFPALLFIFKVQMGTGSVVGKTCFALDTDHPTNDSKLYRYPFGNVNRDGNICFGNIMLPPVKDFTDLDLVVGEFFSGITSNDYYQVGDSNLSRKNQGELASALKKRKTFPTKWLSPKDKTVGELLNKEL